MNILELAKDAGSLALKYKHQDLYESIVTLRENLLELREENLKYRAELEALKKAAEISTKLKKHGNRYFSTDDVKQEQPFCLTCWDADKRLISLIQTRGGFFKCNICLARKKS